jgi:hypothetical protein
MALPHARWLPGKLNNLWLPLPQIRRSVVARAPQSFIELAAHLPQPGNPRTLLRIAPSFQNQAVPQCPRLLIPPSPTCPRRRR